MATINSTYDQYCYYFSSFEDVMQKIRRRKETLSPRPKAVEEKVAKELTLEQKISLNKELRPTRSRDRYKNIIGKRYGRLVAMEFVGVNAHRNARWRCRCDCGNEIVATLSNLQNGNQQSCGCLREDMRNGIIAMRKK